MSNQEDWIAKQLRWIALCAKTDNEIDYRREAASIRLRVMLEVMK